MQRSYPIVVDSYENLELIQLSDADWCVRLTTTAKIFGRKVSSRCEFFTLTIGGMTLLNSDLTYNYSISDEENARRVFNANKVMRGWKHI